MVVGGEPGIDNLTLFRIEPRNGHLLPTGVTLEIGAPVCVKYLPLDDF